MPAINPLACGFTALDLALAEALKVVNPQGCTRIELVLCPGQLPTVTVERTLKSAEGLRLVSAEFCLRQGARIEHDQSTPATPTAGAA